MKAQNKFAPALAIVFILSRLITIGAGVRFDASPLGQYTQIIAPDLLISKPLESLFYFHIQPPLFNAFIATILHLFPNAYLAVFSSVYALMGLVFCLMLYAFMEALGIKRWIAFLLTVLFMIHPSVILYENWLFYSYPIALLLLLSAAVLFKYYQTQKMVYGVIFFTLLGLLSLSKVIFHPYWYILIVFFCLRTFPRRRAVLKACCVPLLVITLLAAKNFMIYYRYSLPPPDAGFQVLKMAAYGVSDDKLSEYVKEGKIPEYIIQEYRRFERMGAKVYQDGGLIETGIGILDTFHKAPGIPNINSIYHAHAFHSYKEPFIRILREHPENYLKSLKRSFTLYFMPGPTDVPMKNREHLAGYENAYNFPFRHLNKINGGLLYSKRLWSHRNMDKLIWDTSSIMFYWFVAAVWLLLVAFLARYICRLKYQDQFVLKISLIYILFSIVYLTCVNNFLADFGNNRYHFAIYPFLVICSGLFLTSVLKSFTPRK